METTLGNPSTYGRRSLLFAGMSGVRVVIALTALVALLAGAGGHAQTLFRCAYTDMVMTSCCCPSAEQPTHSHPVLSRVCCCTIEHVASHLAAGVSAPKAPHETAQVAAVMLTVPYPAPWISGFARRASTPPVPRYRELSRAGPPLAIVHRRLLI